MELKLGYKQTDVGVVPEDWCVKAAKEIGSPVRGGSPRPAGDTRYFDGSYIPWLTVAALTNIPSSQLVVTETDTCLTEQGSLQSRTLNPGTLIIANSGATLGIAKILGIKCCANDGIAALLNLSKAVSSDYIAHFVNSRTNYLREVVATGNGQPNLNTELIGNFKIPFPPTKAEQEAIAHTLSDVDAYIESLERLIPKKRNLKQGAMQELLTGKKRMPGFKGDWKIRQLGEVIAHCYSGATPYRGKPDYYRGAVKWITSGELNYNSINDTLEHISEEAVEKTNLKMHPAGTFLMAITGLEAAGTRGACGIVGSPATTNQSCMAIYPTTELKSEYLYHYYVLRGNELALQYCQGTKQQSYTAKLIKILPIELPPTVEEQTIIATVLSDMDTEIFTLEAKVAKARQIKQGMMQELLSGRIRLVSASEKITNIQSGSGDNKKHNWQINEAVVIGVLANHFGSENFPLARKRCTKLTYLLHRQAERNAEGYLKKAAGPYNPATRYKGPEGIAQKNKYVRVHNNGTYSGFVAADNISEAESYFQKWYGAEMLAWLEQFHFEKTDKLELIATIDMAMQDLRREEKSVELGTVKQVIQSHPEWEAKLEREIFSDKNISWAIEFCKTLFS
jgi:type I restriction enzyme S subunit